MRRKTLPLGLLLIAGCNPTPKPAAATFREGVIPTAPPAAWVRFRPPVGDASVTFPGTPDEMGQPPVPDPTRLYSYPRKDGGAFQFGISTLDAATPPGREPALLDSLRAGSLSRPGVKLEFLRLRQVGGAEASEFTTALPAGDVRIRNLIVVRGRHYYVLTSVGRPDQIGDKESDTFLESFRFEPDPGP